ncbi:MAG: OmpA family protein [Cyclobacteriaceae bacterium]|nr:OmpA family protein [Cyclobacteriaceae bacterium]
MKRLLTILFFLFSMGPLYAQQVFWADTVLEVSSERKLSHHYSMLHPNAYKARMVLGKPNIMPGNEGTGKVWMPRSSNEEDYIKVGFNQPIKVKQVVIAETHNITAIAGLYLYTVSGKEIHIENFRPRTLPLPGRLLHVFIDETAENIAAVKITLSGKNIPGNTGIDAIGISDSYIPVDVSAKIAIGVHTALDPEKMDENINSPYKDLKPLLSPDGNTMFFSRMKHPGNIGGEKDLEDVWMSLRDPETGEWTQAVNAGPQINNEGPNFIASVTPAGYTYLVLLGNEYRNNQKMKNGLSIATKTSDGFSVPESVEINDYENFSKQANFFLASGGRIIVMSVHRRESFGKRDIYVTFQQEDGTWSVPLNLGKTINTGEEEAAPYLAEDGKTLFFSSDGHLGYGGADVFISRRLDDTWTNWSEPENLGTAVNSREDDMFFYLTESDHKYAYFTRGDKKDADIYRLLLPIFHLPEPVVALEGRVLNRKTMEPIGDARITFRETESRVIVHRQYSDKSNGAYNASLPLGKVYELYASAEGFLSIESQEIDMTSFFEPDTLQRDILLDPVEVGKRVPLDNIYFDYNKATLRQESASQLNLIYEFMEENLTARIELDGHTCSMGDEDYNQKLSERRARAVRRYLLDRGIESERVTSIGLGEAAPVASNESEEGREQNRRVEFVIMEK